MLLSHTAACASKVFPLGIKFLKLQLQFYSFKGRVRIQCFLFPSRNENAGPALWPQHLSRYWMVWKSLLTEEGLYWLWWCPKFSYWSSTQLDELVRMTPAHDFRWTFLLILKKAPQGVTEIKHSQNVMDVKSQRLWPLTAETDSVHPLLWMDIWSKSFNLNSLKCPWRITFTGMLLLWGLSDFDLWPLTTQM